MSMTGSLMGYENNNDVNQAKCKKPLKPLPVVSSISSSGVTTSTTKSRKARKSTRKESCIRGHVNSLWSVWYGILAVAFQAYIAMRYAKRFLAYLSLPWQADAPPPKIELYACLVLAGVGIVLLPVLLGAAFLKLGNLANDGIKLGRHLSACSRDPPSSLLSNNPDNSLANNLWRHGGPTAAFVHLCTAMCFLLPSLLMEARLIHAGFLPKDAIWRTDLDWMVIHRDRLVLLSFMNPIGNLSTLTGPITPQPFVTLIPEEGNNENIDELTTSTPGLTNIVLPDVVETRTEETTTLFSTIIHPIVTDPPLSRTTSSPGVTSSKSTTNTEATSTTSRTTLLPKNSTVRRPTTRTITRNGGAKGRSKAKNLTRISTTAKPSRVAGSGNMTAQSMSLTMNSLADLDHPENLNLELQTAESYGPITLEYLNYAAALGVYSLLECVNDDQVTYYASANRDLQPSEGDPSPLLTPDPLPDPPEEPLPLPPPTPTCAPTTDIITAPLTTSAQMNGGQTPRCLRRADSGMPHDELTPRSDSSNSPPLDAVGGGSGGGAGSVTGHSNTSSNSETSSGVHSNASNASNASHSSSQRRATSVDDLTGEPREEPREQWRSCSLQRGTQPPTANTTFSPPSSRPGTSQSFSSPQYVNHVPPFSNVVGNEIGVGCPAVILENPNEATVVIRRKLSRAKLTEPLNANEEPFGRSTNMRMTSFTESNDIRIQASSATLPHYPTQPIVTYPHCSTMPLPHASHSVAAANMSGGSTGSCGSVPRHTFVPPQVHTTMPAHTTLPSHHNGVRLLHNATGNPFVKRFPPVQLHTQPWALPGHHTFPQMPQSNNNKLTVTAQIRQSDRDSANFSMASSGDSDTCLPH